MRPETITLQEDELNSIAVVCTNFDKYKYINMGSPEMEYLSSELRWAENDLSRKGGNDWEAAQYVSETFEDDEDEFYFEVEVIFYDSGERVVSLYTRWI